MGIQHGPNNRRGSTQSGLRDEPRTLRTNSDVLWTYQLTSNVPDHDGHAVPRTDRTGNPHGVHGRHSHTYQKGRWRNRRPTPGKTLTTGPGNAHHTVKKQPIPKYRQMPVRKARSRLPRGLHRREENKNGRSQGRTSKELEAPLKRDRSMTLLGLHRVLLILHQRVLTNHTTTPGLDKEEHRMALERKPTISVREAQRQDVQQASANAPRP